MSTEDKLPICFGLASDHCMCCRVDALTPECQVLHDQLLSRGITDLGGLDTALEHHPQKWGLRDLVALPVVINDGNDEPHFTWVVGLADGRWAAVRGWHDYTGWDCQSDLLTEWYPSEDAAMRTLVDWERDAVEREAA